MPHNPLAQMFPGLPWGQNVSHAGGSLTIGNLGGVGSPELIPEAEGLPPPGSSGRPDGRGGGRKPGRFDDVFDLIDDELLNEFGKAGHGRLTQAEQDRKDAMERAILSLLDISGNIDTTFEARVTDLESRLPVDPFSDKFAQQRINQANDIIRREIADISGVQSADLSARGFGGSGIGSGQFAQLQAKGIGIRSAARQGIYGEQMEFNQEANALREKMINELLNQQTGFTNQVNILRTGLESGSFVDPTASVDFLGDIVTAQMGSDQAADILALQEKLGESLDPSLLEWALRVGSNVFTATGRPGQGGIAQGIAAGLDPLDQWIQDTFFGRDN